MRPETFCPLLPISPFYGKHILHYFSSLGPLWFELQQQKLLLLWQDMKSVLPSQNTSQALLRYSKIPSLESPAKGDPKIKYYGVNIRRNN